MIDSKKLKKLSNKVDDLLKKETRESLLAWIKKDRNRTKKRIEMDNRVFNVNGRTKEQLHEVLRLALMNEYNEERKIEGWLFDKEYGLILMSYISSYNEKIAEKVPKLIKTDSKLITEIVWKWLTESKEQTKLVPMVDWDHNADHDGHNELGFRVYCGDWGKVGSYDGSIVAIKPAYCWYGK